MSDYSTPSLQCGEGLNVDYLSSEYATNGEKCAFITTNENRNANNCFFGKNLAIDVNGGTFTFECNVNASANYTMAILEYDSSWKTVKHISCPPSTTSPEITCSLSEDSTRIWPRLTFPRETTETLYTDNWSLKIIE